MQEELHPHPGAVATGPAGQALPVWGASVWEPCTHGGPYLTQRTHRALWGFGHTCVRAAHFRITHSKGKEMAKCGFVLSAVQLGWSGRCSCFSGQGEASCTFGPAGLGPAFLSPVRTRTRGLLPSALPCPALWMEAGHLPQPSQSLSGTTSLTSFPSARPHVEAEQVLPGHNSSVSCCCKKKNLV